MEELFNLMSKCVETIEKGIKEKAFPEVARIYIERLGRSVRETEGVLKLVLMENTIQTPISPSSRSAIYNLRRAYYAVLSRMEKEKGVDRARSTELWRAAVNKLIEYINAEGISEAPMKIVVTYDIEEEDGKKVLKLKKAAILYFELEGVKELTFE